MRIEIFPVQASSQFVLVNILEQDILLIGGVWDMNSNVVEFASKNNCWLPIQKVVNEVLVHCTKVILEI